MRDKVAYDKVVFERDGLTCSVDVHQAPRLPRQTKVDAAKVPHLQRQVQVDVAKCHATQSAAASRATTAPKRAMRGQPSATSATPATQKPRWM